MTTPNQRHLTGDDVTKAVDRATKSNWNEAQDGARTDQRKDTFNSSEFEYNFENIAYNFLHKMNQYEDAIRNLDLDCDFEPNNKNIINLIENSNVQLSKSLKRLRLKSVDNELFGKPDNTDIEFISKILDDFGNYAKILSYKSSFNFHSRIEYLKNSSRISFKDRLVLLENFAIREAGVGVAKFAEHLFPELSAEHFSLPTVDTPEISEASYAPPSDENLFPSEAPLKWKDRNPGETAPDFARRVYGSFGLSDGIPKRALRKLDAALVNELNAWTRNGNEMPADIKLLTKGEENDRLLGSGAAVIREHLGKFTGAEAVREAQRLHNARYRQKAIQK